MNPVVQPEVRARVDTLLSAKRSEFARLVAEGRWHEKRTKDMNTPKTETVARGREAVCMYPNNSLREPVREYRNAVAEVVKKTFTK